MKKWPILKNLNEKKNLISALLSTQTPPDDWPDTLDRLTISLVANKYTKLGKVKILYLVRGCPIGFIKIPLCYVTLNWSLNRNSGALKI